MDKHQVYPGSIPLDVDQLQPQRNTEIALGFLMQAAFGVGTMIDGLAVTQTAVPSMAVSVGAGSIITLTTVDTVASGFGSLAYDGTDPLVKIGVNLTATTMSALTAPGTAGQSQNWLLEAQFIEADGTPVVLSYYNASNPSIPYTGPLNAGTPNNMARTNRVQFQWKGGTAATTGTQNTPSPDSGWVGVAVVTVANGASSIVNSNITPYSYAPYVPTKLGAQRTRLNANLNVYVATTGSDTSGSGLSASSPFATLQRAWNMVVSQYDLNQFNVTINVANGTYTSGVVCVGMPPGPSSTNSMTGNPANCITFLGNPGSPSSVTISASNSNCFTSQSSNEIVVNGFTLTATGTSGAYSNQGSGLYAIDRGGITFGNVIFGTCSTSHMSAGNGGFISSNGSAYTIGSSAPVHAQVSQTSYISIVNSSVTLSGTPAFSTAFISSTTSSSFLFAGASFSGSATGSRYYIQANGVASSGGVTPPGSTAGSTATGGQYI